MNCVDDSPGWASAPGKRHRRPGQGFPVTIDAADGKGIRLAGTRGVAYRVDLETASRRPLDGGEGMSPLQVLGGDEAALRQGYRITAEGEDTFTLVPETGNPGFRQLKVRLRAYLIESMEIIDNLNQRVEIDFGELQANPGLTPRDFSFEPPEGVDVFYYDQ